MRKQSSWSPFGCLAALLLPNWSSSSQTPLVSEHLSNNHNLNFSSSSPHIFASTFGLLQQWPNTFMPYGHSIIPCEIPINTNLYHARIDSDFPPSPEWFAFDAAMSYAIAGTFNTSHMLTYRTTKNVKCIYFDGTSASLNGDGNMDSQMVLIHNNSMNVPDDPPFGSPRKPNNRTSGDPNGGMLGAEYDRAEGLCNFIRENKLGGRGWGYEGIVRMNAGFELIWCDFESPSARLVSRINTGVPIFEHNTDRAESSGNNHNNRVTAPGSSQMQLITTDYGYPRRPRQTSSLLQGAFLGWLTASANQYGFSDGGTPGRGEVRVRPDTCAMWTFYDTGLVDQEEARVLEERKTLNISSSGTWIAPANETEREVALKRLQRRRRSHRSDHVSEQDGVYMRKAIIQNLRKSFEVGNDCSGIDWHLTAQEIVLEYSSVLRDLVGLLKKVPTDAESSHETIRKWLSLVRQSSHSMMMPYYEYPSTEKIRSSPRKAFDLEAANSRAAYERCRDKYLPLSSIPLAESERLIFLATADVVKGVCQVVLSTFLSVETVWYSHFETPMDSSTRSAIDSAATSWRHGLEELMAWLGLADQWAACNPGCGADELCWIPMWPLSFMTRPGDDMHRESGDEGPPEGRPPRPPPPPYGGPPGGPGHRYGRYGPNFGREDESLLWEPRCMNRTQYMIDAIDRVE